MEIKRLDDDYYLDNFTTLLTHVAERYRGLINAAEQEWYDSLMKRSEAARRLYIRLVSRKGPYFRLDKLKYPEIHDLSAAAIELEQHKLLNFTPQLCSIDIGALLTKAELLSRFSGLNKQDSKTALIENLQRQEPTPKPLAHWLQLQDLRILAPNGYQHLETFRLLFFGNLRQDLSEFVVSELGLIRYENYPLTERRLFEDRQAIDLALEMNRQQQRFEEILSLAFTDQTEQLLLLGTNLIPPFDSPILEHRRQTLINKIARQLERCMRPSDASTLYQLTTLPPSRERQARIQHQQGNLENALKICADIVKEPVSVPEQEFAERFSNRINKERMKAAVIWPEQRITLSYNTRVEDAVAEHYQQQRWQVFWTENTLLTGIFGLLFWEQIFTPLAGVFNHPYQRQPADYNHPDFCSRRQQLFQARLSELNQSNILLQLEACWLSKQGTANPLVNWKELSWPLLQRTIKAIPSTQLKQIFDCFCFDLQSYRSGLPDLIMFREQEYLLVEVKGPGDKLQGNQKRWLTKMIRFNVPCSVVWVSRSNSG